MERAAVLARILPLLWIAPLAQAADVLVPRGATWKYLDNGSNQGTAWRSPSFVDSGWAAGPAQLGYGDGDENTVVSFGPNSNSKYITTYFRHSFTVPDPTIYSVMNVRPLRDDGIVVYLNGTEVARSNMPSGAIGFLTVASSTVSAAGELNYAWINVDPTFLVAGTNVLAVEIHQRSGTSSDLSFDLELLASDREFVTRGPYLQMGTASSMTIRWRTDLTTDGRVWYGLAPNALTMFADDPNVIRQHAVTLTGLAPDTEYFYGVGKTTQMLVGGDSSHSLRTSPPVGSEAPVRVWAIGDSGTADHNAKAVRDAYQAFTGSTHTDVWLMLGDNAYDDGSRPEFQAAVFDTYPDLLRQAVLWPTRGNHETQANVYYDLFTLPAAGQAGGVASGTEAYYSFDHANVHFVCLDSQGSPRAVGGAMYNWLQSDLNATDQEWIVAYWHHPPYTKGSHDSDTEGQLVDMRQNFLPLLESHGVDLVLTGHSHSYERSYLLNGHYGNSGSLVESMKIDGGNGRPTGDGAYIKFPGPNEGAVYCVAGCSGKLSPGPLNHPAMFHAVEVLGSVILDIVGPRMDVVFLDCAGNLEDHYTLLHHNPWTDLGNGLAGTHGTPTLQGQGPMVPGRPITLSLSNALQNTLAVLTIGITELNAPFAGGVMVPFPDFLVVLPTNALGNLDLSGPWFSGAPSSFSSYYQYWIVDAAGPANFAASNALSGITP